MMQASLCNVIMQTFSLPCAADEDGDACSVIPEADAVGAQSYAASAVGDWHLTVPLFMQPVLTVTLAA